MKLQGADEKMIRCKKGMFFELIVFIAVLTVVISMVIVLNNKEGKFPKGYKMGDRQMRLIRNYQSGESALLYVDIAAKSSFNEGVYELAKNGGYYGISKCGHYSGANVWADIAISGKDKKIEECYPEKSNGMDFLDGNAKSFADKNMKRRLSYYNDRYIPADYEYSLIEDNDILSLEGSPKESIHIKIDSEGYYDSYYDEEVKTGSLEEEYNEAGSEESANDECPLSRGIQPKSKGPQDISVIKSCHPEVMQKYRELCSITVGNIPGPCSNGYTKCCISSAYRDSERNYAVGGAKKSYHQKAMALDIHVSKNLREQVNWACIAEKIGFTGIGVYTTKRIIHVDTRSQRYYYIERGGYFGRSSINQIAEEFGLGSNYCERVI